eukprot:7874911-Pyramimonas_sp.AAC.1
MPRTICDETVAELTRIIRGCSATYRTPIVVISGDFNVELPGNTYGDLKGIRYAITGGGVDGRMVYSEE